MEQVEKYTLFNFLSVEIKISGRRLEWQKQMEEYYNCQWAQEDVETLYNLLNNKNKNFCVPSDVTRLEAPVKHTGYHLYRMI